MVEGIYVQAFSLAKLNWREGDCGGTTQNYWARVH